MQSTTLTENEISKIVVDIFYRIHKKIGPGLLESVYEEIACYELTKVGLKFERQAAIPVIYEGIKMAIGFRADIIVEDKLIIEIKSVEKLIPVHYKIFTNYLKLTNKKLGLLVNFNEYLIKDGIHRIANNL